MNTANHQQIPPDVLAAASVDPSAPIVAEYFSRQRDRLGVSLEDGPADWPDELWALYAALREAHEPGRTAALPRKRYANSFLSALLSEAERERINGITDPLTQADAVLESLQRELAGH